MKKSLSAILILLAVINIFAICATTLSFAGDIEDVIPSAPENFVAVNSGTGVNISWSSVEDTAGYKIYRCEIGREYEEIADVRGFEETSFTDKTAQSGTEYKYQIKAYNAFNEGDLSEESSIIYLKQPTLTKAGSVYGGIELIWNKSEGADGYTVYRKNGAEEVVIAEFEGDETCIFLDENVNNNKKYQYTVIAHKGIYRSSFAYKTSKVYITAPTLKKASVYNGYVKVYWEKTEKADKYRVYRKTSGTDWEYLDTVSKKYSSFKDDTIKNGGKYIYTVRAIDGKYNSGYDRDGVTAKYVTTPKKVTLKNYYSNSIRVKWNKVDKAKEYLVYRKDTKNKKWVKLDEVTSTQFRDYETVNGRTYTYAVRAIGENGGKSAYLKDIKITALKAPSEVKLNSVSSGVKVSWTKMTSGTGYRVYKKLKGETDWDLVAKIKGNSTTSYTDTNVKNGKTYIYTVRQVKGSTLGSYSSKGYSIKYVVPPKVSAEHSPKGIVLNWDKAVTGSGYQVQRKAEGEKNWKTISTITSLSKRTYTDSKPVYGKKNNYRIVVADTTLISNTISLFGIDPKKKMVALTYDDGPYTPVTNQILDVLEEYNGRATFFVVGSRVSTYKDCIKREYKLGCEIGNHTYNHTILTSVGASTIKSEISKTNDAVKKITGQAPTIVRTPGGAVNSTVRANVGYPMFNWSVDTLDWKYRNSSSVVSYIKSGVRDGSIILMHDLYGSTGNATEQIVPWLVKNGYQLVTVSELMAVKGIDVQDGQLYTRAY